jgi:hypothetical protein
MGARAKRFWIEEEITVPNQGKIAIEGSRGIRGSSTEGAWREHDGRTVRHPLDVDAYGTNIRSSRDLHASVEPLDYSYSL